MTWDAFARAGAGAAQGEEELRMLWRRYKTTGDPAARDRLILTFAPLVKYVAGRMNSHLPAHVEESDLISYGLMGLIGAVERYDPGRQVKFETYAVTRIKGAIIDELRSLDWVPRSVRARSREIERKATELEHKLQRAPTDEELAAALGMEMHEFQAAITQIANSSIIALDETWSVSSGGESLSLIDTITRPASQQPVGPPGRHGAARHAGRRDRPPARAREDRDRPLLLRRADAPGDRRGARRDREPGQSAPHEGHPAAQGPAAGRGG